MNMLEALREIIRDPRKRARATHWSAPASIGLIAGDPFFTWPDGDNALTMLLKSLLADWEVLSPAEVKERK
jgi:hypothetical protein